MRVLMADWQPARRFGLRLLLSAAEGVEVVGEAETADEAFRLSEEVGPDVVIVSPGMEGGGESALWLCLALKLHSPGREEPPKVMLYGGPEDIPDDGGAEPFYLRSGADSFVGAEAEGEVLLEALGRTHAGERVFFPGGTG